ncbi:hypothetical protein Anapl_11391, partial [Anas platyrhynchos]
RSKGGSMLAFPFLIFSSSSHTVLKDFYWKIQQQGLEPHCSVALETTNRSFHSVT